MTLETRSFFLGIATVAGLVVLGFGGGILMGGVLSGDNKPNKLERQAAEKVETPVQPAIAEAQVKQVPVAEPKPAVVEPKPAVTASPVETSPQPTAPAPQPVLRAETAPLPFAPPQQAAQQEPAKREQQEAAKHEQQEPAKREQKAAGAAATPAGSTLHAEPKLGPERPVALTQPLDQARPLSRREEARLRKEQRRAERAQRRAERRKLIAERREREMARREEMRADRMKPRDLEEDDEDERPVMREHVAPRAPDLPFFRIFN